MYVCMYVCTEYGVGHADMDTCQEPNHLPETVLYDIQLGDWSMMWRRRTLGAGWRINFMVPEHAVEVARLEPTIEVRFPVRVIWPWKRKRPTSGRCRSTSLHRGYDGVT